MPLLDSEEGFVPHMDHRERIYEFPNPWKEGNWGVRGENQHDPARVKWLVLDRIAGKLKGPWLAWGPYLWTNGERGRKDGLVWTCADTRPSDGTHPSASGQRKVAQLLLNFFTTDATARPWFVKPNG